MAEQVAVAGPSQLTWDPDERFGVLRFVERGEGGRVEAETLVTQLAHWVGEPPTPYQLLIDCSEIVDVDASWRAIWSEHFRAHRELASLSWFNANPRIRLIVLMFIKGTGVHGEPFEHEADARAWLAAQRAPR